MSRFVIQIPVQDVEKTVEVVVKVNGERKHVNYRVELFDWPDTGDHSERIDRLKAIINGYEKGWELFQIGPSDADEKIPIVFRQRLK